MELTLKNFEKSWRGPRWRPCRWSSCRWLISRRLRWGLVHHAPARRCSGLRFCRMGHIQRSSRLRSQTCFRFIYRRVYKVITCFPFALFRVVLFLSSSPAPLPGRLRPWKPPITFGTTLCFTPHRVDCAQSIKLPLALL